MATVVLEYVGGIVGGYFGGPEGAAFGSWVGGLVGGYIDNLWISALTAPDPPRLHDLNVLVSTYGNSIPIIFGNKFRIGGNVIWSSELVEQKQGKGGSQTAYTYRVSIAVALAEGVCERVEKIWANGKVIYDETIPGVIPAPTDTDFGYAVDKRFPIGGSAHYFGVFGVLRFYPGSFVQLRDPSIETDKGIDDTPAYRGTCYVVLEGLQLADYGNRLPNLEFQVRAKTGQRVGQIAEDIARRCGIDPGQVSTSQITDVCEGYAIAAPANGSGGLQPLAMAYSFDLAEVWGSLRLQPRGTSLMGVIPLDDLAAYDNSSTRPEALRWPRAPETSLPKMATITYSDPNRDLQSGSQSAIRAGGSADANVSSDLPIVLAADSARQLCDRALWEAWTSRVSATGQLSDRWIAIEPGRCYLVAGPNGFERVKVVTRERGWNGIHAVTLRKDRRELYASTAIGQVAPGSTNEVSIGGDTELQLMDIPFLPGTNDDTGFYYAVLGANAGWRGVDLYQSQDDAAFTAVSRTGRETVMGTVALVTPTGPTDIWDTVTVIRVVLDVVDDELSSQDPGLVLDGLNGCWIGPTSGHGGEVLQFQTATLISPGVYDLSMLLRGRLGTERNTGAHVVAERFVLLSGEPIQQIIQENAELNRTEYWKPVTALQDISEVASIPFANTGENKTPLSPTQLQGVRNGSNDVTLSWTRRTRLVVPGLGNGNVPLGEATESYQTDIVVGGVVKRTILSTTPTLSYVAASQTADGITPGNPVSGVVYQISDIIGRGHGAAFTV